MAPACGLVEGLAAGQVIADHAYDADRLHDVVLDQGGQPVILPRRHRKYQHSYDKIAYKPRWGIEAFFAMTRHRTFIQRQLESRGVCSATRGWTAGK
jgi:transposase